MAPLFIDPRSAVRSAAARARTNFFFAASATTGNNSRHKQQQGVCWKSTAAATTAASGMVNNTPTLAKVPSLPLFGSIKAPKYLDLPEHVPHKMLEFWPEMKRRYGDFYSMGMPGLGLGLHGTVHVIHDPKEMVKLLRREGSHPGGTVEFAWAPIKYGKDRNHASANVLQRGPIWKTARTFIQTDMLSPKSAQRYAPAALAAVECISRGAPEYSTRMNEYLNVASFDMFSNIIIGVESRVSDPSYESDPEDLEFCRAVANGLRINSRLIQSLYDTVMVTQFGVETKRYKDFYENWHRALQIAEKKVSALKAKREKGILTASEEACYANQALIRAENGDTDLNEKEVHEIVSGLVAAGVDTTGNMLTWRLLHVAAHPDAQETLYEELRPLLNDNGKLTPESVTPQAAPYLHACLRESHRLGHATPTVPVKTFEDGVEVHGMQLPPGSVVIFDGYSTGIDPALVDDPMEYRPERFLKEAVEARKGTPSEIIDHAFFSGPFSQGARRCPGSRVANLEAAVLIAQLVLDWKMEIPSISHWSEVPYDQDTLLTAQLPPVQFTARS